MVMMFCGFAGLCWGYTFGASMMFAECSLCGSGSALACNCSVSVAMMADLTVLAPPYEVGVASAAGLLVGFLD